MVVDDSRDIVAEAGWIPQPAEDRAGDLGAGTRVILDRHERLREVMQKRR